MDSHLIAKALAIVGPLLSMIGAALLAYDALRGHGRWYEQDALRQRLDAQANLHESNLRVIAAMPGRSEQEKERLAMEQRTKHLEIIEKVIGEIGGADFEDRVRSQKFALRGFSLVAFGSLLQVMTAVLS